MPRTFLARSQETSGRVVEEYTSQSRDTQMGSCPRHNKGVTIYRAIAICCAHRPRPHGPRPQHPCHQQIKATISRHRRCFPRFGDLSILDRPMLKSFEEKSHNISNLRISHVPKTRFPHLFLSYLLLYLWSNIYFILICCSQRRENT